MRRKKRKSGIGKLFCILCLLMILCAGWYLIRVNRVSLSEVLDSAEATVKSAGAEKILFPKLEIPESEVSGGYYYQQLTEEEQYLYRELYQGISKSEKRIYVHSADMDELKKIGSFLFYDRAELFWCTGAMQITSSAVHSEIAPVYTYEGEEKERRQTEIDAVTQDALSGISPDAPDYEKIKYVFEYLVNTVDYSLDAPDNQNIYSSLVGKLSACAGYSRAAQYLLQKLGISCIYVTGTITEQGPHAWNIVNCDGQYYQMDVTFGDPVFLNEETGTVSPQTIINYDYLCCSDAEILQNHIPDTLVAYPPCPSSELNYYKLNGMYYESYDSEQILEAMNQSVYNQEESFTCKFPDAGIYSQACDDILNRLVPEAVQNLLVTYGLGSAQYTYTKDDTMNKLTVYWEYQ